MNKILLVDDDRELTSLLRKVRISRSFLPKLTR
ncbi:Uncharacterised protein [Klebsiella pneumoniae]|nr:Uncharacterised protein [Klebsiella pneumoniae]SXZ68399.1 Uncharacterised protein [Klebsiella pneumoniae]